MTNIEDSITAADGVPGDHPQDEGSLGASFTRVAQAAKAFTEAELALLKKRGAIVGGATRSIAVLGVIAFIIAFGMIVTLMIGAVLALAPLWGLGYALLAITGAALLAIILCALGIMGQVSRIREGMR